MNFEIKCARCGKCCHVLINGKLQKCKHLIILANNKTLCRVYNKRIGQKICDGFVCGPIEGSAYNYPDCPYNILKPNKQIAPEWQEENDETRI